MNTRLERGATNPVLIVAIILGLGFAGFGAAFVWAFSNYLDQKNNTDQKIASAVQVAKGDQKKIDEADFVEREKQPFSQLKGPTDLGQVTLNYPKTWSVYTTSASNSWFAYLNPGSVPQVSAQQPYAARVAVESKDYNKTLQQYDARVKKGALQSIPITINNLNGVRLDGTFDSTHVGSLVMFKIRDKTLTIATDAVDYKNDFDATIIKTLDFNP